MYTYRNTEKKKDNWTVFVHGIHGELITLSDIPLQEEDIIFHSQCKDWNTRYKDVFNEMYNNAVKVCHTWCFWLGEWMHDLASHTWLWERKMYVNMCVSISICCLFLFIVTPVVLLAYCIVKLVEVSAAIVTECVFTNQTTWMRYDAQGLAQKEFLCSNGGGEWGGLNFILYA